MSNSPAIRFKGFTDPWEQRKLGDVTRRITRKNENLESQLPLTISAQYGLVDQTEFFNNRVASSDLSGYYLLHTGEFAYNKSTSGDSPWGAVKRLERYEKGCVSTLYIAFESLGIDPQFLVTYYETDRWYKGVQAIAAEGARNHGLLNIAPSDFFETELTVPSSSAEQHEIGTLFASFDNLITLHQRKHDQLTVLKKALLDKMFPREGASVPEIRFKGFTDPWEQRKFSEVFSFLRNNTLSRAELSDSEGGTRDVHYGDILIKFGEVIDVRRDELPRIASDALAGRLSCQPLSNGDVIIADTAEDEAVGKCSELRGCSDYPIVSGLHTMACRPEFEFAPGYLGYYMNSPAFHDQLLPLMQGIKVISVSKGAISDTDVRFPSLPEQKAIGASLTELDNLITLHQRKLELLKNLKAACLDKMFV